MTDADRTTDGGTVTRRAAGRAAGAAARPAGEAQASSAHDMLSRASSADDAAGPKVPAV
ncbi:hypothetical protein B7760_01533 [Burkholderia glumae]|nr:hypothetical protein B7760_01533 [Burkholderia glumae]